MRLTHSRERGSVIFFIIILIAIIGGGLYFLLQFKRNSEKEGQQFAREVIQRCAAQHDVKFLNSVVASERRVAIPPATDQQFIESLSKLGVPTNKYDVTGDLQFENYFFSPHGLFKSILTYPDRHGTIYVVITRNSGIWLVTDYGISWERPPE